MQHREHALALLVKALATGGTLLATLGLAGARIGVGGLITALLVLVGIGYPLGDVYLLMQSGNAVATAVDAALALATLWAVGVALAPGGLPAAAVVIAAGGITLAEIFFHRWLERQAGVEARPGDVEPHEREE